MASAEQLAQGTSQPMECNSDGLAPHYSGVASDGKKAAKHREAAMLFSLAESHLDDSENCVECERTAREAFKLFKAVANTKGQADSMRLVVHSYRIKAEQGKYKTGDEQLSEKEVMDEAEKIASDECRAFAAAGNKYGECAMQLCLAEVNHHKRGVAKRAEALEAAVAAEKLAVEIGDKKFEGLANFVLNAIRAKDDQKVEAIALAEKCIKIFKELKERKLEGKSWHMLALSRIHNEEFNDGIVAAMEALNIFRELGNMKLEAYENYIIGTYYLTRNMGREALPFAKESLRLLKKIDYGLGWKSNGYNMIVDCYLSIGDMKEALATSDEHLKTLQESKDRRAEATALLKLSHIHMEAFNLKEALSAAEEALDVAQIMKDDKWTAFMMRQVAQIHLAQKDYDQAEKFAEQAAELVSKLDDKHDEAIIRGTLTEIAIARQDLQGISLAVNEQKALFQQTGDKANEAVMLLQSANILASENKTEEALEVVAEAMEICGEINDVKGEANAYKARASIYRYSGDNESALEAATKMREKLKSTGDQAAEGSACSLLAQIHLQRDNPAEAVKFASVGQQLCKKAGDRRAEAELWILMSSCLLEKFAQNSGEEIHKNRNKILKPAQEALAMAKKVNDRELVGQALYQVGSVHMATGRIGDAMQAANEARTIFHSRGNTSAEASVVLLIAETQYAAGKEEKALEQAQNTIKLANECGDGQLVGRANELIERIEGPKRQPVQMAAPQVEPVQGAPGVAADAPELGASVAIAKEKAPVLDIAQVTSQVKDVVGQVIGGDEDFAVDDALMDVGLDSLSALGFRQGLQQQMKVKLPSSFVFDYPSIRSVVDRIIELHENPE